MTHFNRNGFMLVEVMVAIAAIGIILTPVYLLQATIFGQTADVCTSFDRVIMARSYLEQARREVKDESRSFTLEKKENNPETVLKYQLKELDKKSSLAAVKGLLIEQVDASAIPVKNKTAVVETIITFNYKPESKKA